MRCMKKQDIKEEKNKISTTDIFGLEELIKGDLADIREIPKLLDYKEDLLKNKYFLWVVAALVVAGVIAFLIDYNSVESKCERHYRGMDFMFGAGSGLDELQIEAASKPLIQKCIERGGPQNLY